MKPVFINWNQITGKTRETERKIMINTPLKPFLDMLAVTRPKKNINKNKRIPCCFVPKAAAVKIPVATYHSRFLVSVALKKVYNENMKNEKTTNSALKPLKLCKKASENTEDKKPNLESIFLANI